MKRNAMAIYMSDSSLPIESAWSVLKGHDPDKVEKFLPLALGFGALGAYTGAGGKFYDPETGEFFVMPWDENAGPALAQDPITGGLLAEKELGDSVGARVAGAGIGMLQGANPFAVVGAAGKGLKGARLAREADLATDALRVGDDAARAALQAGKGNRAAYLEGVTAQQRALHPTGNTFITPQGTIDTTMSAGQALREIPGRAGLALERGLLGAGKSKYARGLGRLAQAAGQLEQQIGPAASALMTTAAMNNFANGGYGVDFGQGMQGNDTSAGAFGAVGGQSSAFGQDYNVSNLPTANSALTERREIWKPEERSAFESQLEYGMKQKGDLMFTYRAGDEIRKQVEELMYKGKCPACGKSPCTCDDKEKSMCKACGEMSKMCGCEKKAEDGKKPAHGMVIVIGSKATPGPSTEGKRDKLDSEKKEE